MKYRLFEKISLDKIKSIVKGKTPSEIVQYDWDKLAFGFSEDDVIKIPLHSLNVKYKDDMLNTQGDLKKYFNNKSFSNLPPIEVSYEKGKFYIEDGHHRYVYAKKLGINKISVYIDRIKDNPILALGFNSIDDLIKLSLGK